MAMVNEVFEFLRDAFVIFLLLEVSTLVFVSIHETFKEKQDKLRRYYREKHRRNQD